MKNLVYIVLVLFFTISCVNKNKTVTPNKSTENEKIKDNKDNDVFKVYLDVKALEDDKFQLFYKDTSPDAKYDVKKRIEVKIKGSNDYQTVLFELPQNILPYMFRIDLGEAGYETPIDINFVKIEMNSKQILIDQTTINRFLSKNIYLETENGLTFQRKKVSGNYDPFLTSTTFLIKKIELEL